MNNEFDYEILWKALRNLLKICHEDTESEKMVNEKKMYVDLLNVLDTLENEMIKIQEENNESKESN